MNHLTIIKLSGLLAALLLLPLEGIVAQKIYTTNKGHVSFFANAPVADVDARNDKAKFQLNTTTGELSINVAMTDFQFKNKKMGRDAQAKYIETAKFSQSSFIGKITGKVDYNKPGSYPVNAVGKLKIHGTEREVNEKGTIKITKRTIGIHSEFNVALNDYTIETPKILGQAMTEDKVIVKIEATLSPRSK
jgi:polyisoprenoid-binding protein YceI